MKFLTSSFPMSNAQVCVELPSQHNLLTLLEHTEQTLQNKI